MAGRTGYLQRRQAAALGFAELREEKKLFIKQADVYAAYQAYADNEIGRVIQAVEDIGQLDNTLIIYISGDNGASAEGMVNGTPERVHHLQRHRGAGQGSVPLVRVLGFRPDLPALLGGVGLGVRHAVQMDEAGAVAFRRHGAGHGDLVARPHRATRAASAASSTT